MSDGASAPAFWTRSPKALLTSLAESPEGLGSAEARLRLAQNSPNRVEGDTIKDLGGIEMLCTDKTST